MRGRQIPATTAAMSGFGLLSSMMGGDWWAVSFREASSMADSGRREQWLDPNKSGSHAGVTTLGTLLIGVSASSYPSKHQCFWPAGAGQEGAMFVHARSYEDLTESEDGAASGDSPKEGARGPPPLPADMRQISQDFSELSTQLTGVARDLQEEMLPGSSEDWLDPPGAVGRPATEPPREGTAEGDEEDATEAWRLHQKHVFVLSEAGKPVYSRYGSEEALSSTMGVMVALVSFLEADKNAIRSIHAGEPPGEGMGWAPLAKVHS